MANQQDLFEQERAAKRAKRSLTRRQNDVKRSRRARAAAAELSCWGPVNLDLRLLLNELTADSKVKWLHFTLFGGKTFVVSRLRLKELAQERRRNSRMKRMTAWVDSAGLQIRWGERGGLTMRSDTAVKEAEPSLAVSFPKLVAQPSNAA